MPRASGSHPPVSTSEKPPSPHSALYVTRVAGHTGGVLHDGFATAEDPVHERGLAHVRSPDDRHDGKRRAEQDAIFAESDAGEQRRVLIVQVVVGEPGAQRLRPLLGEMLVDLFHLLGELSGPPSYSSSATVCSLDSLDHREDGVDGLGKSSSVESTTSTPSAAFRKSTTALSEASRLCNAAADSCRVLGRRVHRHVERPELRGPQ